LVEEEEEENQEALRRNKVWRINPLAQDATDTSSQVGAT
jgi:hypothetical protein